MNVRVKRHRLVDRVRGRCFCLVLFYARSTHDFQGNIILIISQYICTSNDQSTDFIETNA